MEDSPSPVYGAALLMRFGGNTIRGSNPRSSAQLTGIFRASVRRSGYAGLVIFCRSPGTQGRWDELVPPYQELAASIG
jgi:hypothetical protein